MTKFYTLTVLFILSFSLAKAQHIGYFVTKKSDTVNCLKIRVNLTGKIKYQIKKGDDFKDLDLANTNEYQFTIDSTIFIRKRCGDTTTCFMQWLQRGKINLYEQITTSSYYVMGAGGMGHSSSSSVYTWWASKGNDSLVVIKTNAMTARNTSHKERKQNFMDMISDKPGLLALFIEDDLYSLDNIRSYISQYNNSVLGEGK